MGHCRLPCPAAASLTGPAEPGPGGRGHARLSARSRGFRILPCDRGWPAGHSWWQRQGSNLHGLSSAGSWCSALPCPGQGDGPGEKMWCHRAVHAARIPRQAPRRPRAPPDVLMGRAGGPAGSHPVAADSPGEGGGDVGGGRSGARKRSRHGQTDAATAQL